MKKHRAIHIQQMGFILLCLLFGFTVVSCNTDEVSNPTILTPEFKAILNETADEVFRQTATPGLLALVSVEGEPDFIIKRGGK